MRGEFCRGGGSFLWFPRPAFTTEERARLRVRRSEDPVCLSGLHAVSGDIQRDAFSFTEQPTFFSFKCEKQYIVFPIRFII